jgi:transcriptional regulator with XRE-family HTH domain
MGLKVKKPQLYARVELLCAERGMSMAAFARHLGMTRQGLYAMLMRGNPRIGQLQRLARGLAVPVDDLLAQVNPAEYGRAALDSARRATAT